MSTQYRLLALAVCLLACLAFPGCSSAPKTVTLGCKCISACECGSNCPCKSGSRCDVNCKCEKAPCCVTKPAAPTKKTGDKE